MKEIINEIRLLIAETLLGWAADIAPKETEEGKDILLTVYDYMRRAVVKSTIKIINKN